MEINELPETEQGWLELLASDSKGVVRNIDNWKELLVSSGNPLHHVDAETLNEFTASLKFSSIGLAGAKYGMLEDKLTLRQFKQLWAHFGLSWRMFKDYDGYYCSSRATCSTSASCICTSNC